MNSRISQSAIALVVLIGFLVLLGWQFNISLFKNPFPGSLSIMKANTALCFVLSGIALGLCQINFKIDNLKLKSNLNFLIFIISFFIIIIGFLTLSQDLFNWQLGIDQLLFRDNSLSLVTSYPGRMGANTALSFVLVGIALLLLRHNTHSSAWLAQLLSGFTAFMAMLALLGHLWGISILSKLAAQTTSMAPHTALTLIVLAAGIWTACPGRGFMQTLTSPLAGGLMARRLLPWAIALPLVLSWLIFQGIKAGWYDHPLGNALLVMAMTIALSALIWWTARSLNRIERDRQRAEAELRQAKAELEIRVAERTAELTQANQRFQAFMNYSPAAAWIMDTNGILLYTNRTYLQTFHLPADNIIGQSIFELYPAESAQHFLAITQRVAQTNQVIEEIQKVPCSNGKISEVLVYKFPIFGSSGQTIVGGFAVDITERKALERELAQKQQLLDAFITSAPVGMTVLDSQLRFSLINEALAEINGLPTAEHLGKTPWEIVPDLAPKQERIFQQVLTTGEPILYVELSGETQKLPGILRTWLVSYFPIRSQDPQPIGIGIVVAEITARKQAEEALRAIFEGTATATGENFFRSLVKHLANALHVRFAFLAELIDVEHPRARLLTMWTGTDYSESFEYDLQGTPCEQVVGKSLAHFPANVQQCFPDDLWLREAGIESYLAIPLFSSTGVPLGHLGVMHDREFNLSVSAEPILRIFAARAGAELERQQAEAALRRSEERWQLILKGNNDGIWDLNLKTQEVFRSARWKEILGYEDSEISNSPNEWTARIHPDDYERVIQNRADYLHRIIPNYAIEYRMQCKDGSYKWILVRAQAVWDEAGNPIRLLGTMRDISDRKQVEEKLQLQAQEVQVANQELQRLATLDGLTQLANRRRFDEALNLEWRRHLREQASLSLIFLDVDYFKCYNDTYGHLAGDDCLRQVAAAIHAVVKRSTDLVARYGGEEFVVLLPDTTAEGAIYVAESMRRVVHDLAIPHVQSSVSNYVTVSLGVASIVPNHDLFPQMLITAADQALYLAKQQGRDRCYQLAPSAHQ